ncbi:hypothetical protein D3C73_1128580 [compost metagenome]
MNGTSPEPGQGNHHQLDAELQQAGNPEAAPQEQCRCREQQKLQQLLCIRRLYRLMQRHQPRGEQPHNSQREQQTVIQRNTASVTRLAVLRLFRNRPPR